MSPSPNYLTSIALVGASGTIGSHILSSLLALQTANPERNIKITALTRANSTATFPPTIKTATIDYSEPHTIVSALAGHDCLIITLSVSAPPDSQEILIRAAAHADVKWILPNEFGMFSSEAAQVETVGDGKIRARESIKDLGMYWVGISCGFWYEHSLSNGELFGIDVRKGRREVVLFTDRDGEGGKEGRINVSTWRCVGDVVGKVVSLPIEANAADGIEVHEGKVTLSDYKNKTLFISSFALSQREMLASVQRVTQTTDAEWKITNVDARRRFEEARERVRIGDRSAFGRMLYARYFIDEEGLFEKTHGLENERLGLEVEDLDEATRTAVELGESGYWDRYGKN